MSHDLHGSCPDSSRVALLIVDMINGMEFADGEALLRHAEPMADRLAALAGRARAAKIPVIYVNDNFGRWRSDFTALIAHVRSETRGRTLADRLEPHPQDYFVLKPKHSGFFATGLEVLLQYLDVHWIVLTGIASNICVLFTANDAYMRDYGIVVPRDCVAACSEAINEQALAMMRTTLKISTPSSTELDLEAYFDAGRTPAPRSMVTTP